MTASVVALWLVIAFLADGILMVLMPRTTAQRRTQIMVVLLIVSFLLVYGMPYVVRAGG